MSKPIEAQVLERALLLLNKGWVQDSFAEDKKGLEVSPLSKSAVSFCAVGAIRRAVFDVTGKKNPELVTAVERGVCKSEGITSRVVEMKGTVVRIVKVNYRPLWLINLNDSKGKKEVKRVLRKRLAQL